MLKISLSSLEWKMQTSVCLMHMCALVECLTDEKLKESYRMSRVGIERESVSEVVSWRTYFLRSQNHLTKKAKLVPSNKLIESFKLSG